MGGAGSGTRKALVQNTVLAGQEREHLLGAGFTKSLAWPGGTITGLSIAQDEAFAGKLLELVKETLPKTARVGVILESGQPIQCARREGDRSAGDKTRLAAVVLQAAAVRGH